MKNGKHLVLANKVLMVKYWEELVENANENNGKFSFEVIIGEKIPVLQPLNEYLTENHFKNIYGIMKVQLIIF